MNQKQIERIMTEKVATYILDGYTINPTTMAGHQGEIGKVDLRKGDEVIRVILERKNDYGETFPYWSEYVALTVGRYTVNPRSRQPFDVWATLWNNEMEVLEERRFYMINNRKDFFVEDLATYRLMQEKHNQRSNHSWKKMTREDVTEKVRRIAERYITRKTGKKITRRNAGNVKAYRQDDSGRIQYIVCYGNTAYTLK